MNQYKIELYNGEQFVDISDIIQTNMNIQDKLDLTLDSASFVIPHAKQSYEDIPNIDFSKPIKPMTPVKITINNGYETFRFYTSNSPVSIIAKGSQKRYKHEVNLIEASKALSTKTIPDMTVTQPKSEMMNSKYFSESKSTNTIIQNTPVVLPIETVNDSNNYDYIQEQTIKAGKESKIYLSLDIRNDQYIAPIRPFYSNYTRSPDTTLEINFYANGVSIPGSNRTVYVQGATSKKQYIWPLDILILDEPYLLRTGFTIDRIPAVDETITVKINTIGTYSKCNDGGGCTVVEDAITIENAYLTLATEKSTDVILYKTITSEAEKILASVNSANGTDYYLSEDTIAKLESITCPEFTFQSYTAWDALERLANKVNAIPEVGLNNYKEVSFTFLDEEPDIEYNLSNFSDQTQTYILDDFNSGYEINASNVIEEDDLKNTKIEPYINGWMSPRINNVEVSQFTEENASFKVRQNIYRIYNVFIKGPKVRITNGSNNITLNGNCRVTQSGVKYVDDTISENDVWDISDLVVESQKWNTLENGTRNDSDIERRQINTKGNHIKYTQGTKYIEGLAYKTDEVSTFIGQKVAPRALMEVIMRKAADYLADLKAESIYIGYDVAQPTVIDYDPEYAITVASGSDFKLFRGVYAQIHYMPLADVRATVYRHNAFDIGVDTVKYANEQDKVNDITNLGHSTMVTINKLGNISYTATGNTKEYEKIPKLGFKTTDGKYVLGRSLSLNKNLINFDLELSENFLNQSSYVGPGSAYRQFEVPNQDIVFRQDKYTEFVLVTTDKQNNLPVDTNFTLRGLQAISENFHKNPSSYVVSPISYGKMTITKTKDSSELDNVKSFDMPINGFSLGTTLGLQLEMDDNYSAGPKIQSTYVYSEGAWKLRDDRMVQSYAGYTNQFGELYAYELQLRQRGSDTLTQDDTNEYPFLVNDNYNSYNEDWFNLNKINVYKDAREKYGLTIQLPFISTNLNNIRVFEGISKYNALIRKKTNMTLGFAKLSEGYFPNINDKYLDTGRSIIIDSNYATRQTDTTNKTYGITYSNVLVEAGEKIQGYAVYEKETKELIFAVNHPVDRTDLASTNFSFPTVWFINKRQLNTHMYPEE